MLGFALLCLARLPCLAEHSSHGRKREEEERGFGGGGRGGGGGGARVAFEGCARPSTGAAKMGMKRSELTCRLPMRGCEAMFGVVASSNSSRRGAAFRPGPWLISRC